MHQRLRMSRLQLKIWLGTAIAVLIGFIAVQIDHYRASREGIIQTALIEARTLHAVLTATRKVYSQLFLDSKLPLTEQTIDLLPVHALAHIAAEMRAQEPSQLTIKIASLESRNPDNHPDAVESADIAYFAEHPDATERLTPFTAPDGARFYYYSLPIRTESYCLECHGDPKDVPDAVRGPLQPASGYVEGSIRGVSSIRLPMDDIEAHANAYFLKSLRDHVLVFLTLFVVGGALLQHFVIGKVRRIQAGATALEQGHYDARLPVQGDDELADLAKAFNRMADSIALRDKRLRDAQASAHLGFWTLDAQSAKGEWSEEAYRILDLDPSTPAGPETLKQCLNPKDAQMVLDSLQDSMEHGHPHDIDYRILRPSGEERWVHCRARPIKDRNGQVRHLEGYVQDITARKTVERRLAESEEQLRVALESIRDAFIITDAASDRIMAWNPAAERIFGYSAKEAIGRSVHPLLAPAHYHTSARRQLEHFARTGQGPVVGETLELEGLRKDGSTVPVELSLSAMQLGERWLAIGLARDISERKRAEQALSEREQRLSSIFRAAPIGIGLLQARIFKEVNATFCAMVGFTREELLEQSARIVYPSDLEFARVGREKYEQVKRTGTGNVETRLRRKNGEIIHVLLSSTLIDKENPAEGTTFTVMDITKQRLANQALEGERAFLQHVIDGIDDPILVIASDYRVLRMNRVARQSIIDAEFDASCLKCHRISHHSEQPCSGDDHPCPLREVLDTGNPCKLIHNHRGRNGEPRTFEIAASPLRGEHNEIIGIIESSRDITDQLALMEQLREKDLSYAHLVQHDPLTGLPNRLLFADRLSQGIRRAHRRDNKLAVLFIDLDRFKHINDSFDHNYGDEVLRAVSTRLKTIFREDDTVARMGGDEFAVILTEIKDDSDAALVARKVLNLFGDHFEIQDHSIFLGASIGLSIYPEHGTNVDELVRNADAAMHRAKEEGRNTYQYYAQELTSKAFERVRLEASLHQAILREELILHYQPQLDLKTGSLCGVEALVRWQHPEMGLVSPARFIPLAEESGLILEIGEWVLREATRQMKAWQDTGVMAKGALMSVNLSVKQFDQEDMIEQIHAALEDSGLDSACLELEITESIMLQAPELAAKRLSRLRDLGIRIAVDDFGTGYSSLGYLRSLPLTKLKIDQSFVADLPSDPNDVAIAKAVIGLARSLSLEVLAEGIETQAQLDFLVREGCQSGQGYLFSRPLDAAAIEHYLRQYKASDWAPRTDETLRA
ncbi:EAL domain-containing protein [Thiorhodococcus mannitoliphagus]|uniref:cyclic-guanylate-specific phosphodiesterase n=1 Tax=Thiorhodococcus mannitoliphagus TaxID=329406 RepID=A0A6P1DXU9_9GAMM|nr:EAL domain-containing protein [Thiorhodococcus mannitoliphagus]NEX21903.1 EAL domain-containing protein [Thiorhodococcus mannitoliphagus]